MEFTFETEYHQQALTVMARALRKTLRKKRSRRSHVFGWIVVILGLLLSLPFGDDAFQIDLKTVVTWLAVLLILVVLIWEDAINGYFAGKRMLPGTEKATTVFNIEEYTSTTDAGKTEWKYDKINAIVETTRYFVFVFSSSHAQIYDKKGLSGGTADEFRSFIENMTHQTVQQIK